MKVIERHTPRGIDLADAEGYDAEGPEKEELERRVDTIINRGQRIIMIIPNLGTLGLLDANKNLWDISGSWEDGQLETLYFDIKTGEKKVHICLVRSGAQTAYPLIDYMRYSPGALAESNTEQVLSITEQLADELFKPMEEKMAPTPSGQ